ncbi:MAG: anti-sigma-F factor Fin family protein [Bacillaceae bacterium]|nr:anti-sigma-F factor Fin family protein [Bacillaceae bacterium]
MSVKYVCRYCGKEIGSIHDNHITEYQLGFHFLTPEERKHIISYTSDGDIVARVICEYCQEALERNPELSNPLQ